MLELKVNEQSLFKLNDEGEKWTIEGKEVNWDIIKLSDNEFNIIKDGQSFNCTLVSNDDKTYKLLVNDNDYDVSIKNDLDLLLDKMGISAANNAVENELKAPMPGLVLDVKVEVGQEVKEGDALLVLEAMKMENILKSPADVVIKSIGVEKGNNVEKNAVLLEFE